MTKKAIQDFSELSISELVDMKAKIDAKVKELEADPAFVQKKAIDDAILSYVERKKVPANQCAVYLGKQYQLEVGEKALKRTIINMPKLRDIMESIREGLFIQSCTVPLAVVDEWLNPEQCKEVLKEEKIGNRRMKLTKVK